VCDHVERSEVIALDDRFARREAAILRSLRISRDWQSVLSAEDILQETYHALLARAATAGGGCASLAQMAQLRAARILDETIDALRAGGRLLPEQRRSLREVQARLAVELPDPLARLGDEHDRSALLATFEQLPDECRTVLRLNLADAIPMRHIARHLGQSSAWVKDAAHRGVIALRRTLGPMLELE
jgi:DNA-directed RNA polymerase specialized sigma24 family protein